MALSTQIEAKSPEDVAPQEIELPAMEPVPADRGAPGLSGWLSRPAFTVAVGLAALLLGAVVVFVTPLAFPPRAGRLPPPLPPRPAARRPPHLPPSPLPDWMRAPSPQAARPAPRPTGQKVGIQVFRSSGVQGPNTPRQSTTPQSADSRPERLNARTPERLNPLPAGPIRIREPSGAVGVIAPQGVRMGAQRVPSEWAREVRRLLVMPPAEEAEAAPERPALRLLAPDPGDAAVFSPPERLQWSAVPGVDHYLLTLEVLTDPAEQIWHPVRDLFLVEVKGTEYSVPAELKWAPGAVYRWRVQTGDGRAAAAGRFRVLSDTQRARLLDARRDLGGSRLLRAAIYHSFGLNDAALTELRTLRSVQPGNPALQRATMLVQADIRRQRAAAATE